MLGFVISLFCFKSTFRGWRSLLKRAWEVKYRLGHVRMQTTELYVRREAAMNHEYVSLVVRTAEEACKAVEGGYKYETSIDGVQVWRKPL